MQQSEFETLDDGHVCATIPGCPGLIIFADSKAEAVTELRGALEDWVWLGLRLGHPIPPIDGIDLASGVPLEPVDAY